VRDEAHGAASGWRAMIGWAVRQLAIWGGLALLLFAVGHRLTVQQGAPIPAPTASQPSAGSAPGAVPNSLVFHANSQGHVVLDGAVNGTAVQFLVDTGATMVVLTLRDAAAAGFGSNDLNFSMKTSTANGVARAAPVRLRELRVGQLSLYDVPAAVAENLGISLLGQSFLTRLDSYEMRDGVLTLNYW
jgi:aspartyl protease family protein